MFNCTGNQRLLVIVEVAIRKELKSFGDLSVFEPILNSKAENVMSSRWVLRWKQIDGTKVVKAR